MSSYSDQWVEERVITDSVLGGGCDCCGLTSIAQATAAHMAQCTDVDTDAVASLRHSIWPPEMLETMWRDRVLLRSRLKQETLTFRCFFEEYGDDLATVWRSVPCARCNPVSVDDARAQDVAANVSNVAYPVCSACGRWSPATKAAMLRVRLDDVYARIVAGGIDDDDGADPSADNVDNAQNSAQVQAQTGQHSEGCRRTRWFAHSSLSAWRSVLEQLAHGYPVHLRGYLPTFNSWRANSNSAAADESELTDAPSDCVNPFAAVKTAQQVPKKWLLSRLSLENNSSSSADTFVVDAEAKSEDAQFAQRALQQARALRSSLAIPEQSF